MGEARRNKRVKSENYTTERKVKEGNKCLKQNVEIKINTMKISFSELIRKKS